MHLSMWAYPWDVQDLGYDCAESEFRDRAGLNTVSLATSYHAGRFLQPRSPKRKAYFPAARLDWVRAAAETVWIAHVIADKGPR